MDDSKEMDPEDGSKSTLLENPITQNLKPADKGQIYSKDKKESLMVSFFEESPIPPSEGDLVEGPVMGIGPNAVYVDLAPFGTGIIFGRELMHARDIIKRINIGDTVSGKIVEARNEDGYIEISLKEARQAIVWAEAEEAVKNKTVFEVPIQEANKGGLIMNWQGIQGFLPASQLNQEHYPKVEDGNKDKILDELRKFVGEKINVAIISAIPKEGKLIFSEKKEGEAEEKQNLTKKYEVGDLLEGEVTGIVDFGVFVKIDDNIEGLAHISELDWGLVEDPRALFKVGEKVKAKVIEVKYGKISLSIKALKDNPWKEASKKYSKGQKVEGVVIKFNKYGALASIEEGVAGLVHISEFGNEETLRKSLELGKTYTFTITNFEPEEQKLTLSFLNNQEKEVEE